MSTSHPRIFLAVAFSSMAFLAAALTGCSSGEARTTVDARSPGSGPDDYKLVYLDPAFADKVAVDKVARRNVDGFLQVQVTLVSTSIRPIAIETSWEWYDRDGFRIDGGRDGWIPAELGAKTTMEIRGIAPKPDLDSFKFHVRAAMPIR